MAALAKKLKVDVIIIGEAFAESTGQIGDTHSYRARLEARAILSDSSEILAAVSDDAPGTNVSSAIAAKKSLEQAGQKVAMKLIAKLELYQQSRGGVSAAERARQDDSKLVRVIADQAQVRLEANGASAVMAQSPNQTALKVRDQEGAWYQVELADGTQGWVHQQEVSPPFAKDAEPE